MLLSNRDLTIRPQQDIIPSLDCAQYLYHEKIAVLRLKTDPDSLLRLKTDPDSLLRLKTDPDSLLRFLKLSFASSTVSFGTHASFFYAACP